MVKPDILVVGASAGGVQALQHLITSLSKNFNGYVFIVLHIHPSSPSALPEILARCNIFKVAHAKDGEKIERKKIYIAPPDHHLLIEDDVVLVKKGPKENRFRPSVDALFRSAAYSYGVRVVGIVLSGFLDDGTSGMWTIKRLGGTTMVQKTSDAIHPEMPLSVQEFVDVDYVLPVCEMGDIIEGLKNKPLPKKHLQKIDTGIIKLEVNIAKQQNAFSLDIINKGELTSFTCPECHGALVRLVEDKITRFRCHMGHAYTPSALLAGITQTIEESLWASIRAMKECALLLNKLKGDSIKNKNLNAAAAFEKAEKEYLKKAGIVHDSVFTQNMLTEHQLQHAKEKNNKPALGNKRKNNKLLE